MNELCRDYGIEYPIFAFSHCRDVVAAVSKAGGLGVLGVVAMSPEEIDIELTWLERNCGRAPFGVDVVFPANTIDRKNALGDATTVFQDLGRLVPDEHRAFAEKLMQDWGVPPDDGAVGSTSGHGRGALGLTAAYGAEQLEAVFGHKCPLLVSALGPPPRPAVDRAHEAGARVATLVGKPEHLQKSAGLGIDLYVCQSYEAAAHTGEIGAMVLIPDVVDAANGVPVVAAGGIGSGRQMAAAMALGAQGVWTGSIWLTTAESSTDPRTIQRMLKMSSTDTVRSKSQTGKYNRQMRTAWTEAWDGPDSPGNLPMPLQNILYSNCTTRARRAGVYELVGGPVGQIVSRMNNVRSSADVILEIVEEYLETIDRMTALKAELEA
jgi:NAD(P)H-dependent flavin oxidoreductase YrpB (nitropropane dioxygenase family)